MTTQAILDLLNSEESDRNFLKAIIAKTFCRTKLTLKDEEVLDKVMKYYFDNEAITSFIDFSIYREAGELFTKLEEEEAAEEEINF